VIEEYKINNWDAFYPQTFDKFSECESVANESIDMGGFDEFGLPDDGIPESVPMEEKVMRMVEATALTNDQNKYLYFDKDRAQNWAGPQFWKSRIPKSSANREKKQPVKRKIKAKLDFSIANTLKREEILAKSKATTFLPKNTFSSGETFTLPEDLNFNSTVFARLFLKPKFTVFSF
jgi:hypothetical protein